ncbi:hypothetical protein [Oligosphaera ethanolica]|uniref:Uncharacterized protein n=1 Tax=Oligosphaera ethanolica TaxID=760260 RepID=A0AAE4APB5_9BACT|nr:hypothetical protein [Oligosphaera ethanolica]MDQ0289798.1 hypothetical protein [Oligosphaera ethanolica]
MVTNQLLAGDCRMICEEHCSYEIRCPVSHPWVMAGRRRAVGFLQIVPGEFPAGAVTDRLPVRSVTGVKHWQRCESF